MSSQIGVRVYRLHPTSCLSLDSFCPTRNHFISPTCFNLSSAISQFNSTVEQVRLLPILLLSEPSDSVVICDARGDEGHLEKQGRCASPGTDRDAVTCKLNISQRFANKSGTDGLDAFLCDILVPPDSFSRDPLLPLRLAHCRLAFRPLESVIPPTPDNYVQEPRVYHLKPGLLFCPAT